MIDEYFKYASVMIQECFNASSMHQVCIKYASIVPVSEHTPSFLCLQHPKYDLGGLLLYLHN